MVTLKVLSSEHMCGTGLTARRVSTALETISTKLSPGAELLLLVLLLLIPPSVKKRRKKRKKGGTKKWCLVGR